MRKNNLFKLIFAALLMLLFCTACFAGTLNIVSGGIKKGTVSTRTGAAGTDVAVDEAIAKLGYTRKDAAQSLVISSGGKKAEFWDKSDVARVCGNIVMLLCPAEFADGHWWVEKKGAENVFSELSAAGGENAKVSFSAAAGVYAAAPKSSPAKSVQTQTKPAQKSRRMTVKQLIAQRQKQKALAAGTTAKPAADTPQTDTDKFLAGLEAENKAAGKKQAERDKAAVQMQQAEETQNRTAKESLPAVEATPVAGGTAAAVIKQEFSGTRPRVVIDAGHGAHDPGAIGHNTREKDINLKAAITLGNILERYGAEVLYTRSTDVFLKLQERTAFANKKNADVFVSLHCNSLPKPTDSVKGIEIYLMASPRDKDSLRLAIEENKEVSGSANSVADLEKADKKTRLLLKILGDMQQTNKISESTQLIESLDKSIKANGLQLRKVSQAPFFVLRGAGMPAVLIEMGYLSSATDTKKLNSAAYREQLSLGVAQGIVEYIKTHKKL